MSKKNTSRRVEFSSKTRSLLAERAGNKCSFEGCVIDTTGPAFTVGGEQGSGGIAVAAHIFAAAENGPRPGRELTHEEISHISNGIWMCSNHGKQIDTFEAENPAHALIAMKTVREFAQQLTISNPHVSYFVPWMGVRRLDSIVRAHFPDLDKEKIINEIMVEGARCMPIADGAKMPMPSEKFALAALSEFVRAVVSEMSTPTVGTSPSHPYSVRDDFVAPIFGGLGSEDGHWQPKEITHNVLMASLGQWYFSSNGYELLYRSDRPQATFNGDLSFAIVVEPNSGICHCEIFLGRKNSSQWVEKPQLRDFFHRAWTRLGVPDILEFKTPGYCLLPDDMADEMVTLDEFGTQMGIKVVHGKYHVERCTKDELAAHIMKVLYRSISRAHSFYESSIEEEFFSPAWEWHSENLVLLGALVSEVFPEIWCDLRKSLKIFNSESVQHQPKNELNNAWLIHGLHEWKANHWSQTEYYPYNWGDSRDWTPLGLGVNTEPDDFYRNDVYRFK